jgi:putative membrane protein
VARTDSKKHLSLHFRVRPVLVRWIVSAICLFLTVLLVPHVYYEGDYPVLSWLIISAVFALLTTFVKPLIQLLLLPLIFVSYGLVIVLINTLIIWFLAVIFPGRFHVDFIVWALVAGLVSGLLIGLLENLFGLSPPIVQGGPDALKKEMALAKPGRVEAGLLDAAGRGKSKLRHHHERHHRDAGAEPERPEEERP